jgi:nicotinamidase-related amidase
VKPTGAAKGTVLLCLDVQPVFLRAIPDGDRILGRCSFAAASAAGLNIPVAFTEQVPAKLGATEPSLVALAGQAEIHAKDAFSAFAPGSLTRERLLEGGSTLRLLVCGLETPICVYQTAIDAVKEGLAVTVLSDCVGARREADSRACLHALALAGVQVLPSETVFYSIISHSQHPFFKAYTELVKKYA